MTETNYGQTESRLSGKMKAAELVDRDINILGVFGTLANFRV